MGVRPKQCLLENSCNIDAIWQSIRCHACMQAVQTFDQNKVTTPPVPGGHTRVHNLHFKYISSLKSLDRCTGLTCMMVGSYFQMAESNKPDLAHKSSLTHSTSLLPGCSAAGTTTVPSALYPDGGRGSHILTGLCPFWRHIRWNSLAGFTGGFLPFLLSSLYT